MNPKPINETEAIRSDIEMTRRRMDETMDALGERLHGRHLLDEVIGFFRHNSDQAEAAAGRAKEKISAASDQIREQVTAAATTAGRAVADTVKKNPVPVVLIGAGVAWMAYAAFKRRREEQQTTEMFENEPYDPDLHYDRQLEYPGGAMAKMGAPDDESETSQSKLGEMKDTVTEKIGEATDQLQDKMSDLADRARESFQSVRERAGAITDRAKEQTRAIYSRSRDQVAQTIDEHPLEVGLGCLAAGLLIGLALPTPSPVHRFAGPTVERLRNRTRESGRDLLQRGRRVARAAADAAKHEAEAQGLTLDQLRRRGSAAGESARQDANESADPSASGPAM